MLSFSYRFADEILNSKYSIKKEFEKILTSTGDDITDLSRPRYNQLLKEKLTKCGWEDQPSVFSEPNDPSAKFDFLKERVGVEVEFGHSSFLGIDLLKFQVASYSGYNKIDAGIYVVTTKNFQKMMKEEYYQNWEGSLTYEKVVRYLPHFKSAIQVPILVMGIDR
ncbi:MAG: Restriction endonuclease BglII [Methanomassiliicoccales archaeon PtaU1.Bin124]|nr:MAG: Restriction endonuclease BglII [Methanomassiliicoccales archaeon PtaU1.Bin124]